jgi:hypothetical protein
MTAPRLNFGDWLHLVQIAVLFMSLGMIFSEYRETAAQVRQHTEQLTRIEHYLSSRDPEYWRIARETYSPIGAH